MCPQCLTPLTEGETPVGSARACESCDHVWIEAGAMDRFQEAAERRYTPDDLRALKSEAKERKQAALDRPVVYCRCPGCEKQMLRRTFGEQSFLLVHFCATHGYWIQRDDLAGIIDYIERGGELLEMKYALQKLEEHQRQLRTENRELERRAASTGFVPIFFPI